MHTAWAANSSENCNFRAKGKGFDKKFCMKISGNLNHCSHGKCNVGLRNDEIVCNGGLKFKSAGPCAGHWLANQQL